MSEQNPMYQFGGNPQSQSYFDKMEEYRTELEFLRPRFKDNEKSLEYAESSLHSAYLKNEKVESEKEELEKCLKEKTQQHIGDQKHIEHAEAAFIEVERQLGEEKKQREDDKKTLLKLQDELKEEKKLVKHCDNVKATQTAQVKTAERKVTASEKLVKARDDEIAELKEKFKEAGKFYQGPDGSVVRTDPYIAQLEKTKEDFEVMNEGLKKDVTNLQRQVDELKSEVKHKEGEIEEKENFSRIKHRLNKRLEGELLQLRYTHTEEQLKLQYGSRQLFDKEWTQGMEAAQRSHAEGLDRIKAYIEGRATNEDGETNNKPRSLDQKSGEEGAQVEGDGMFFESLVPDSLYMVSTVSSISTQTEEEVAAKTVSCSTQTEPEVVTVEPEKIPLPTLTEAEVESLKEECLEAESLGGVKPEENTIPRPQMSWLTRCLGHQPSKMALLAVMLVVLVVASVWAWTQGSMAMEERAMWMLANERAYPLSDEILRRQALALAFMTGGGGYLTPEKVVSVYHPTLARPFLA